MASSMGVEVLSRHITSRSKKMTLTFADQCHSVKISGRSLLPVLLLFPLVWRAQIAARFVQRALSAVAGLDGLAILVDRALTLSGHVKYLAQLDMAPDLGPARLAIAVERLAVLIRGRLVVALQVENLGNAVVGQRAVLVYCQRFVEFR